MKWSLYRVLFWLVLCSSFSSFSVSAAKLYTAAGDGGTYPTLLEAADAWGAYYGKTYVPCSVQPFVGTGGTCAVNDWCSQAAPVDNPTIGYCSGPFVGGAVISGECPEGYIENETGDCVVDPCPETAGQTVTSSFGFYYFATSGSDFGPSPVGCFNSCKYRVANGFQGPLPFGSGFMLVASQMVGVGEGCGGVFNVDIIPAADIPSVPPETDPNTDGEPDGPGDCPAGTGFAQVNNQSMCLPSGTQGSGPSTSSTSTTSTTTTDPVTGETTTTTNTTSGGSGTVTTSSGSNWVINGDGTVTVETTKTVDLGDGQTATSTTSTTGGIANVTVGSSSSSGGSGGGTGSGSGEGSGDSDLGPPPSWSDPGNGGLDPDLPVGSALPVFETNTGILGAGGGACPAPVVFVAMGQEFVFSLDALCDWAGFFSTFLLIVAGFASLRILVMA